MSLANAEISGIFGLDEIDTKKLSQAQKKLALLFSVLFDRRGIMCSVARLAGVFTQKSSALWHIKRPFRYYPKDVLTDEIIDKLDSLVKTAEEKFSSEF